MGPGAQISLDVEEYSVGQNYFLKNTEYYKISDIPANHDFGHHLNFPNA